jgi:hypothetical protein
MIIESLLASNNTATWLVGTRRLGKTSLLRRLEEITRGQLTEALRHRGDVKPDACRVHLPLYLDLQGCESPADVAYELELALEDRRAELTGLGIEVDSLPIGNAVLLLRQLARMTYERDVRLLLLIDEGEALLSVAANDARWLGALRKALLEGRIRTVLTSTRLLSRLNHLNAGWDTSPFLFGFQLVNLWALGSDMSAALIRQTQATPVHVPDTLVAQIQAYCNGHPYLIQYLCERLFEVDAGGNGTLRRVTEADLQVDHLLAGFFLVDYRNMTRVERRILLCLSSMTLASEQEVLNALVDIPPGRVRTFLYGLSRLGYARNIRSQWAIGNEFLRRWLLEMYDDLSTRLDSVLNEEEEEHHLRDGARDEASRLRAKIEALEEEASTLRRRLPKSDPRERGRINRRLREIDIELTRLRNALERTTRAGHDSDTP